MLKRKFQVIAYILAAIVLLSGFFFYIYSYLKQNIKLPSTNEEAITLTIAEQLNKNPNQLSGDDYNNITELHLSNLSGIAIKIPKWKSFLAKYHIINISYIESDLNTLRKMPNLETLSIESSTITNIDALSYLKKLKSLRLSNIKTSDITGRDRIPHLSERDRGGSRYERDVPPVP